MPPARPCSTRGPGNGPRRSSSLLWIREVVAPDESVGTLLDEAARVPAGADGLVFLPFLMGERAGFAGSAPAALIGLHPGHRGGHFVRAVLEGVSFELRRMRDHWFAAGEGPSEVRVVGGGTKNPLWMQVLADTFDVSMTRLDRDSAFGAAVLAGMGIGWWTHAPDSGHVRPVRPDRRAAPVAAAAYQRYREIYEALGAPASQKEPGR